MTQTRSYKGFTPTMGIFIIKNLQSGKALIGASEHVQAKLNSYQFQLKMNSCMVRSLQEDYNRLGVDQFTFEVLDVLEPDPSRGPAYDYREDLKDLENLWLEKLQPYEPMGYHRPPKN